MGVDSGQAGEPRGVWKGPPQEPFGGGHGEREGSVYRGYDRVYAGGGELEGGVGGDLVARQGKYLSTGAPLSQGVQGKPSG